MNRDQTNLLLLFLLGAMWGPSFMFIKIAVEHIPPITMTAARLGIGALMLFLILKIKGTKFPKLKPVWKKLAFAGLIQSAIPFTLFAVGEQYVSSSIGAIINGTAPLFTLITAHFFTQNDRLTKAKTTGASIGFIGLFVLIFPSFFIGHSSTIGIIALLIGAICYAVAFVYIKKNIDVASFPALTIPTFQMTVGAIFLFVFAVIFEDPQVIFVAPLSSLASVCALAFLGTTIAFIIYYKLIQQTNATYVSMVNYITPVFGVVLGMLVLDEKLEWNSYLGCILILCGVMIANGILKFRKSRSNPSVPVA